MHRKTAFILKGYPRLSETFIAQEIRGLEELGLDIHIFSLRPPREAERHPIHGEIRAGVTYLPERLRDAPGTVLSALWHGLRQGGFPRALHAWAGDMLREPSLDRARRFGQALVLARELTPDIERLHAHFLHTPASVARYASLLTGLPWSCSAHARDIWTISRREKRSKLEAMDWLVTCTRAGLRHLSSLASDPARVSLVYHGIDLDRFPPPPARPSRNGGDRQNPVRLLSVGRAVEKKGFDVLLDALSQLPDTLHWRWTHVGAGEALARLRSQAEALGLSERIDWLGARAQAEVIACYREAELLVLPSREATDGDRDGLPNVLMEAQSQGLACLSTRFSGIPELIENGETGVLVEPGSVEELRDALDALIRDPARRARLGAAGNGRVREQFSHRTGLAELARRFGLQPTSAA